MILKNKIIISFFGLSVVLLFASALIGGSGLPSSSGLLIIRFDKLANQADFVGGFRTVFGLGVVVSFMLIINFLLAWEIYHRERFLSYILAAATLIVSLLFLMVVSGIAAVN